MVLLLRGLGYVYGHGDAKGPFLDTIFQESFRRSCNMVNVNILCAYRYCTCT